MSLYHSEKTFFIAEEKVQKIAPKSVTLFVWSPIFICFVSLHFKRYFHISYL